MTMGMSKSSLYLPVIANAECPGPLLMTVCFLVTLIQLGKAEFDRWWLYTRDGMARLVPMDHLSPAVSTTLFIWGLFDEPREAINQSLRCKMTLLVNSFHLLTRSAKSPPEDIHFAPPHPDELIIKSTLDVEKWSRLVFTQLMEIPTGLDLI